MSAEVGISTSQNKNNYVPDVLKNGKVADACSDLKHVKEEENWVTIWPSWEFCTMREKENGPGEMSNQMWLTVTAV